MSLGLVRVLGSCLVRIGSSSQEDARNAQNSFQSTEFNYTRSCTPIAEKKKCRRRRKAVVDTPESDRLRA